MPRIRNESTRLFRTHYKGRYRLAKKTVWYMKNGIQKHELILTDVNERFVMKKWVWFLDVSGNVIEMEPPNLGYTSFKNKRIMDILNVPEASRELDEI